LESALMSPFHQHFLSHFLALYYSYFKVTSKYSQHIS
jgi:hypothetical protein